MIVNYENCRTCKNSQKPSGRTSAKIKCRFRACDLNYSVDLEDDSWDCKDYLKG